MTSTPELVCPHCQSTEYRTEVSGPHIKAICAKCDRYIKFIPQGMTEDSEIGFGKHVGKKLKEIPPQYFIWMYDNAKVTGSLKRWIEQNRSTLEQRVFESK